jgi:tripartite-type tricarboxylate transporter receptor subunit TctC
MPAAVAALKDANLTDKLTKLGQQVASPDLQSAQAFAAFQKSEADKWWPIIKEAGIKVQ